MDFGKIKQLLHRSSDWLTEWLIYLAVIFGPWAFGTTQAWSIHAMNWAGCALGLLFLVKALVRRAGYQPSRWTGIPGAVVPRRSWIGMLAAGTFCILLYCLISAANARAVYHPDRWSFEYLAAVPWLPHSYDQAASWEAFWKYLGLAGLFWGVRDWLLTLSPGEVAHVPFERHPNQAGSQLPVRLRRLFWVMAINGALLAAQGLMQRAEGGNKILWLVVPRFNRNVTDQFGPYAYRANAAQYFNLLWPAVLGFWWACVSAARRCRSLERVARKSRAAALLPCAFLMAVCPLVSTSRGGAIVLVLNLILAGAVLFTAQWRGSWTGKVVLLFALAAVVGSGLWLGWKALRPRMEVLHEGYEEREGYYLAGKYMARDNAVFGTGPGTFMTMYQLYRRVETDEWLAYMHNDWLETVITFGWVGAIPIFLTLLLVPCQWLRGRGIYGNKYFVMLLWVGLGGCLVHACFDFPLQIHSILALFLVLCAVQCSLARRTASSSG